MDIIPEGLVDSAIEWADGLGSRPCNSNIHRGSVTTNPTRSFSLEYDPRRK